jgi:hypothetical protein
VLFEKDCQKVISAFSGSLSLSLSENENENENKKTIWDQFFFFFSNYGASMYLIS